VNRLSSRLDLVAELLLRSPQADKPREIILARIADLQSSRSPRAVPSCSDR